MLITVVSVSSDEEVLEILCDEYSVRTKQKKGEKGKRMAESWQQQQIIMANVPQICL